MKVLVNRVSTIIRRYVDHMNFAAIWLYPLSHSSTFFWFHFFIIVYMLYVLGVSVSFYKLCNFIVMFRCSYSYVCSVLCILFHFVILRIVCVQMCTGLLPPGVNQTAVKKIYQIVKSNN